MFSTFTKKAATFFNLPAWMGNGSIEADGSFGRGYKRTSKHYLGSILALLNNYYEHLYASSAITPAQDKTAVSFDDRYRLFDENEPTQSRRFARLDTKLKNLITKLREAMEVNFDGWKFAISREGEPEKVWWYPSFYDNVDGYLAFGNGITNHQWVSMWGVGDTLAQALPNMESFFKEEICKSGSDVEGSLIPYEFLRALNLEDQAGRVVHGGDKAAVGATFLDALEEDGWLHSSVSMPNSFRALIQPFTHRLQNLADPHNRLVAAALVLSSVDSLYQIVQIPRCRYELEKYCRSTYSQLLIHRIQLEWTLGANYVGPDEMRVKDFEFTDGATMNAFYDRINRVALDDGSPFLDYKQNGDVGFSFGSWGATTEFDHNIFADKDEVRIVANDLPYYDSSREEYASWVVISPYATGNAIIWAVYFIFGDLHTGRKSDLYHETRDTPSGEGEVSVAYGISAYNSYILKAPARVGSGENADFVLTPCGAVLPVKDVATAGTKELWGKVIDEGKPSSSTRNEVRFDIEDTEYLIREDELTDRTQDELKRLYTEAKNVFKDSHDLKFLSDEIVYPKDAINFQSGEVSEKNVRLGEEVNAEFVGAGDLAFQLLYDSSSTGKKNIINIGKVYSRAHHEGAAEGWKEIVWTDDHLVRIGAITFSRAATLNHSKAYDASGSCRFDLAFLHRTRIAFDGVRLESSD